MQMRLGFGRVCESFMIQVLVGETGFAGDSPCWVVPAILVDGKPLALNHGDYITVWDEEDQVIFAGPIIKVPETTRVQVPWGNPRTYTPTVAEGKEVRHFLRLNQGQLGYSNWYQLFFDPEGDLTTYNRYLRARVIRGIPGMAALYGRISQVYWTPPKFPRFTFKVGVTYAFFETGTEGVIWVVDGQNGPYDFHYLQEGDLLYVWERGRGLFAGFVIPDVRCTSIEGWRIHWLPFLIAPSRWGELFFKRKVYPSGTVVHRVTGSGEGLYIEQYTLEVETTSLSGGDALNPAVVLTFWPLTAIAKVLQRMLAGPPASE